MTQSLLAKNPNMLYALGFMIVAATGIIYFASTRVASKTKQVLRTLLRSSANSKKHKAAMAELRPEGVDSMSLSDVLKFPLQGSCVLFGLYLAIRYIPKEYLMAAVKGYLCLVSVGGMSIAVKPAIGASPLIGLGCIAVGVAYFVTGHWVLNNVMAIALSILTTELLRFKSIGVAAVLLVGLFFYDIFWVFGTDVMVTVAKNIEGPIKLLFPQDIFGDHTQKSLLGLGDIVIPGCFMMQVLRMSLLRSSGRSAFYFNVAIVAYVLSLVNTMAVMVVFKAAQPALLYIVPWLLVTLVGAAALRGEAAAVLEFDEDAFFEHMGKQLEERAKEQGALTEKRQRDKRAASESLDRDVFGPPSSSDDDEADDAAQPEGKAPELTTLQELKEMALTLFGLDAAYQAELRAAEAKKLRKKTK